MVIIVIRRLHQSMRHAMLHGLYMNTIMSHRRSCHLPRLISERIKRAKVRLSAGFRPEWIHLGSLSRSADPLAALSGVQGSVVW